MARKVRASGIAVVLLVSGVFVLFGGSWTASAAQQIWTTDTDFGTNASFDGTQVVGTGAAASVVLMKDNLDWSNMNPSTSPGVRESPGMAYSVATGVTVEFGGRDATGYNNQTWEYEFATNTWTRIMTSTEPSPRRGAGMSYDSSREVIVLFGGYGPSGYLRDTWEYDVAARTWTQLSPPTYPPGMPGCAFVYDSFASRHILAGIDSGGTWITWAYDAATQTWQNRAPTSTPSARSGYALAYHEALRVTVMFGGTLFMNFLNDTWEYSYSANQWANRTTAVAPSPRAGHAMTYWPGAASIVLFGGLPVQQETWLYADSRDWIRMYPSTNPPARQYAGFTYDTGSDLGVLFGGVTSTGTRLGDTWTLGPAYRTVGRYTSAVFDSLGANVDWQFVFWNLSSQPAGATLAFQLAASSQQTGPFLGRGPDGQFSTFYTISGTPIWSGLDNLRYLVFFGEFRTTNTQATPVLADLTIQYNIPEFDPYIVSTDPPDASTSVPLTKNIRVVFSEPMDTSTVTWTIDPPISLTPSWSSGDSVLDLAHAVPFAESTLYTVRIDGQDLQGKSLIPNPFDPMIVNPWIFMTEAVFPYITATDPSQGQTDVLPSAPIIVDFSEPMNPATVTWTISPNTTLTPTWSMGDARLTLSHVTDLPQCTLHTVQVDGRDKGGNPLIPGSTPNPWTFTTACINPYITATQPIHQEGNVAVNRPIIVDFSKSMNTNSVTVTVVPSVGALVHSWSLGNQRLTVTHVQVFTGCQAYTVTVAGSDTSGNSLIPGPPGSPPNPWQFMTICSNPYILFAVPDADETNVSLIQEVLIGFSEAMDTGSFVYTIVPSVIPMNEYWDQDQVFHLQHAGFAQCTRYTVTVTQARNVAGLPLVPGFVPNPWSFDTICENPYVVSTDPKDGDVMVPLAKPVVVRFSEPMETATMFVDISPPISVTRIWSDGDRTLTLTHAADFENCTTYVVFVDGYGIDGNRLIPGPVPNPWSFTSICVVPNPYIVLTDPADGQQNVPRNAPIVVTFSEAIVPATFQVSLVPFVSLTPLWSAGNTVVTLTHTTLFPECVVHQATVSARDVDGNGLTNVTGSKPNPWSFRAACVAPWIVTTDPQDGATGVALAAPVVVTFSEAMNTGSVTWTIVPSITLTPAWSAGNTVLTLSHGASFLPSTVYTVTIGGRDLDGNQLVSGPVPNPWSFTTTTGLAAPRGLQVTRMLPNDIMLSWSAVSGATSYVVYSSINRFSAWPWPQLGEVPATSYFAAGHGSDGLQHYYVVRAKDAAGALSVNSTMGAKIQMTFTYNAVQSNVYWISLPYRTMYKRASDISDELTSFRIDVVAKWDPSTQSSILWYFFRGGWRGTNFPIAAGDGLYLGVRAGFSWVVNGTDGNVPLSFVFHPLPSRNINWISLPYTSTYRQASDIVLDIEGSLGPGANTRIVEVAKWDALTRSLLIFRWTSTGWTGDFAIGAGEGIYLRVVASFQWTPRLITPEVT